MRGNQGKDPGALATPRSIPACAGEPGWRYLSVRWQGVYPRVCGGTEVWEGDSYGTCGLSPRVRGNLLLPERVGPSWGSIPACAGEPLGFWCACLGRRVYPRVCGGTKATRETGRRSGGLSPRVRGNHIEVGRVDVPIRSIPACAGEPQKSTRKGVRRPVYPRVCGGTSASYRKNPPPKGLSPRVRGNRRVLQNLIKIPQSIPACAGEPRTCGRKWRRMTVYPRVCGGTKHKLLRGKSMEGLSPRVRGNLIRIPSVERWHGSIPACAGEPPPPTAARLSPRVRGNPLAELFPSG